MTDAAQLYEKWRVNPHISLKSSHIENNTFRNTFNHNYNDLVKPVNDNLLTQRLHQGKTYYTDLKEKIVQIPITPVYHANKLNAHTYRDIISPESTVRSQLAKTKYNMSMYAKDIKSETAQSPLGMSMYHKNADATTAYTYLKRAREDDVKTDTH